MKTEVLSVKLPLHEAAIVCRQAANLGLTKSSYGANLLMRGMDVESSERLPNVFDRLQQVLDQLERQAARPANGSELPPSGAANNAELRAFMIETLLILRYLVKSDLKLGGEIGRKLQKAVGEIRVAGL